MNFTDLSITVGTTNESVPALFDLPKPNKAEFLVQDGFYITWDEVFAYRHGPLPKRVENRLNVSQSEVQDFILSDKYDALPKYLDDDQKVVHFIYETGEHGKNKEFVPMKREFSREMTGEGETQDGQKICSLYLVGQDDIFEVYVATKYNVLTKC